MGGMTGFEPAAFWSRTIKMQDLLRSKKADKVSTIPPFLSTWELASIFLGEKLYWCKRD